MRSRIARGIAGRILAVLAILALGILGTPLPAGAEVKPCDELPEVFPQKDLGPGLMGTGWTAVEGREPVSFDVEVLGVLEDGIAPGLDFILIHVSGPVIDQTGGIAAGFSGSPVYIDGNLAGAVSYHFFASDQTLGGMTPAGPIVDMLAYPTGWPGTEMPMAKRVPLPRSLRAAAAQAAGVQTASFAGEAERLRLPLSVSGVAAGHLASIAERMEGRGVWVIPYVGGSAPAPTPDMEAPAALEPGQPLAAVLSYGDITYGASGTVTAVCGDFAVAFGHEFNLTGRGPSTGFSAADVLTVVPDPSGLEGPWKFTSIAEPHGVVDQDRQAGVRGVEGLFPKAMFPVTTDITNRDTGRELAGETDIVARGPEIRWIASDHVYYNLRSTLEAHGGTVTMVWTISGTADGEAFTISRRNMHAGSYVLGEATDELYRELEALQRQRFASVRFTDIEMRATVTEVRRTAGVRRARSGSSVEPTLETRRSLDVVAGDTISVVVPLVPDDGSRIVQMRFHIHIPDEVTGDGRLEITTGRTDQDFHAHSFPELVQRIIHSGHNNDLVVTLKMRGMDRRIRLVFPQGYVLDREGQHVDLNLVH